MDRLVEKYADKLIAAGLAGKEGNSRPIVGGLDDQLVWSRKGPETETLEVVFSGLHINSLVFLRPAEPYRTIISYLADTADEAIAPKDCETRTFLHELSVASEFTSAAIIRNLKSRKSVIVYPGGQAGEGPAVVAHGTVSPEQGFVVASSVCFACYVKFFADYLDSMQSGGVTAAFQDAFDRVVAHIPEMKTRPPGLSRAPFTTEEAVYKAVSEAGRATVDYQLVDSYFGNVSFHWAHNLYISQTGSSLDELDRHVDPVPMDGSTTAGLTASSELTAHMEVIRRTGCRAILHGHPKFAVILSMDCTPEEKARCEFTRQCHIKCPRPRFVADVPIVPGEVGTGPTGLCHTLPPALKDHSGAIVYGHGLFTIGRDDFNEAFVSMMEIEALCRRQYFEKVEALNR